jgi:hypothetical protein
MIFTKNTKKTSPQPQNWTPMNTNSNDADPKLDNLIDCPSNLPQTWSSEADLIMSLPEQMQGILDLVRERAAYWNGVSHALDRLERRIESIARDNCELRKENEKLLLLSGDVCLKLVRAVAPEDLRCFSAILALGDRAKAARHLGIPRQSFYHRVASWSTRGPEYKRMTRIIQARTRIARNGDVRLPDSVLYGGISDDAENPKSVQGVLERIKSPDSAGDNSVSLLKDILGALADMNPENWRAIREELLPIIKEELP